MLNNALIHKTCYVKQRVTYVKNVANAIGELSRKEFS